MCREKSDLRFQTRFGIVYVSSQNFTGEKLIWRTEYKNINKLYKLEMQFYKKKLDSTKIDFAPN
jgi:hypothetical protein